MKIVYNTLLSAAFIGLTACTDDPKAENKTQATNPAATVKTNNTATALNPEHGQPNHRCDIPVGAPLNAPAQPRLNAPMVAPPTSTSGNSQAAQAVVAAGTNPPHGYPGHDCSKPVGAKLDE